VDEVVGQRCYTKCDRLKKTPARQSQQGQVGGILRSGHWEFFDWVHVNLGGTAGHIERIGKWIAVFLVAATAI